MKKKRNRSMQLGLCEPFNGEAISRDRHAFVINSEQTVTMKLRAP